MSISLDKKNYDIPIKTTLPLWLNDFFIYIQKKQLPLLNRIFDHRNLIVFAPRLIWQMSAQLKKAKPTHMTTSSFAVCKNIKIPKSVIKSILYIHSPMQYIHSHAQEYSTKIRWRKGYIRKKVVPRLLRRDTTPRPAYDEMYANSRYTAYLTKEIYWRDCKVKYPQIHMWTLLETTNLKTKIQQYTKSDKVTELILNNEIFYIYIWRVVKFVKEVDRIIDLFNFTGDQLLILWSGPDEEELKAQANTNIHFLGRIDDSDLKTTLLSRSSWLINITKESYGLVTAEAISLWVPVFGYNQWGSVELVTESKGVLVESKDHESLVKDWERFKSKFDK